MKKPVLVFKVGTSSLTRPDGRINEILLRDFARQLARLSAQYHLVIVSSGAVGSGKKFIRGYAGSLGERKAAAAVGNPLLMALYADAFRPYDITIAQSLCERQHFAQRTQFLQLKETYHELWRNGIIPIANENDVVSSLELRFSDNDELATRIAIGFGASMLLIGTSVPGVLDAEGKVVPLIERFDEQVLGLATKEKSDVGLGGMISKLSCARLATSLGVETVIFGAREHDGLLLAAQGQTGTRCLARPSSVSARQKWLAGGCIVRGRLRVDAGAEKALLQRKSLLAVGIREIQGDFEEGEMVEIVGETVMPFAVARASVGSQALRPLLGTKNVEWAHADDIILL